MKKIYLLVILFLGIQFHSNATHVRGGEFSYTYLGANTFQVTIKTYTEISNGLAADQDSLAFCWGDGFCDTLGRIMYPTIAYGNDGQSIYEIRQNIYVGTHTYAGFGIYGLTVQDVNRVDGIVNFVNSVETPLFVSDTLYFRDPSIYGPVGNSPVLSSYAVDFGYVGTVFHHYPAAYDPDGDSLSFQFYIPLQAAGTPVSDWVWPDSVAPIVPGNTFTIDAATGEITWNIPEYVGFCNVGIEITKYRKSYYNSTPQYFVTGTMMRDLQIIIGPRPPTNSPPVVAVNDTCIIAGSQLTKTIIATDSVPNELITITMDGGPFEVTESPATATQTYTGIGLSRELFNWSTVCGHSNSYNYPLLIRATNSDFYPLTTTALWNIKVSAPSPQQLTATATSDSTELSWQNNYTCDTSYSKNFIGFSLWRCKGSNPFIVDTCVNGLAGRGYTEIAHQLMAYNCADYTSVAGTQYCYRLLAEFGYATSSGYVYNVVRSLASNEACVVSLDTNLNVQNIAETRINLTLFPNPVENMLGISLSGATTETGIELYDLLGEKLLTYIEPASNFIQKNINLSSFADGMYIVSIHVNGNEYNRKVIKQ